MPHGGHDDGAHDAAGSNVMDHVGGTLATRVWHVPAVQQRIAGLMGLAACAGQLAPLLFRRVHALPSGCLWRALAGACSQRGRLGSGGPMSCTRVAAVTAQRAQRLALLLGRAGMSTSIAVPRTSYPPADASRGATADLCDVFVPEPVDIVSQRKVQIMDPIFRDFGGNIRFSGPVSTVKCFENNPLVRKALEEPGEGRVLVVDGGGSTRCALLGDNLAEMAYKNGWNGIILHGCVRDSQDIAKMPLGVKALNTYPLKSSKRDLGLRDVPVSFGGVHITPSSWLYADADGILVSPEELVLK